VNKCWPYEFIYWKVMGIEEQKRGDEVAAGIPEKISLR
jgi:hypothetical protein